MHTIPNAPPRKLLILDLDETLVHATDVPLLGRAPDFRVGHYSVYKRPHLNAFLASCLRTFDVAVWTSSTRDYATEVVAAIFPNPCALVFLWARERCCRRFDPELVEYYWRKPLSKLVRRNKTYPRGSILAIDDSPEKWEQSYSNLVRVRPFEGDPDDTELRDLTPYLETLAAAPDVRKIEKRDWRRQMKRSLDDGMMTGCNNQYGR